MPDTPPPPPPAPLNPLQSVVLDASANEPLREVRFPGTLSILAILSYGLVSAAFLLMEGWMNLSGREDDLLRRALFTLQIVRVILYVIAAIWFLRWTWLCAANARRIAPSNPDINPATAIGSYFVPLLNLFAPYQQLVEITEVTEKRLARFDLKPLLRPWWLAWWGMNAMWFLDADFHVPSVIAGELLLVIFASAFAIRLVAKLSGAQSEIRPPFEVVRAKPRPPPKREQRQYKKPAIEAAKPSADLPRRTPGAGPRPPAPPKAGD